MDPLLMDLRYTFRMLRQTPVVSIVVILSLALGMAGVTTVRTIVGGLLGPLPFNHPDRLVRFYIAGMIGIYDCLPLERFRDWKDQQQIFQDLAAYLEVTLDHKAHGYTEQMLYENAESRVKSSATRDLM